MNLDWGWFSIGIPTLKIFDNLIVRQYQYDTEMSRLFRSPKVMSQVESNSAWSTPHHHGTRLTWNKTEDPTDWYHPPAEDQTWTPTSETPNPRISLREKTVFWGVPCQFGIHKDISQKKYITISPCHENWLPSAQPRERSNVAAMAADQGGGVEPPANISTKKILETIASLLATKDPWGPRGEKASNENRWSRLRGPRMGWFKTEVIKDVLSYGGLICVTYFFILNWTWLYLINPTRSA